jgi:hypothetical protein
MSLAQIEGFSSLRKDTANGGVVNVDTKMYENHKAQKMLALRNMQQQKSTQDTMSNLQSEINMIKNDMNDIRSMLIQLLEKGN